MISLDRVTGTWLLVHYVASWVSDSHVTEDNREWSGTASAEVGPRE